MYQVQQRENPRTNQLHRFLKIKASRNFRINHSVLRQSFPARLLEEFYVNKEKYPQNLERMKCSIFCVFILCTRHTSEITIKKTWIGKVQGHSRCIA